MILIDDIEQCSEEWFQHRLGIPSASRFKDVLSKGSGSTRKKYLYAKAAEILTGETPESYTNEHMARGIEQEPAARALYELTSDIEVKEVGLAMLDDKSACASPDGVVGDHGGLEIKSVIPTVHIETILSGKMPPAHMAQVQGCMWILERDWWDFVSYSPLVIDQPIFIRRIIRDEQYINKLKLEIDLFNQELAEIVEKIKNASN